MPGDEQQHDVGEQLGNLQAPATTNVLISTALASSRLGRSDDLRLRAPSNRVVNAPTHGRVNLQ
jgi:hypothetical protein